MHNILLPSEREQEELLLLRATVRKLHAERKTMHQMLTEAGIRTDVLADGVNTCLIGRLAIAIGRICQPIQCDEPH